MGIVTSSRSGITIFSDIQRAIKLAEGEGISRRNKHIDVTYHFVCDVVSGSEVRLEYKSTSKMDADAQRKPLRRKGFERTFKLEAYRASGSMIQIDKRGVLVKTGLEYTHNYDKFEFYDRYCTSNF